MRLIEKARPLYDRFCEFAEKIENRLEESEVATLYEFLDEISELEEKEERSRPEAPPELNRN